MKLLGTGLLVCLLIFVLMPAHAQERSASADPGVGSSPANPGAVPPPEGVGTIQFDNDTPFNRDPALGGTVGNRFSPSTTHSIATVSFALAGNFGGSVVMTVWDVNAASVVTLQRELVLGLVSSPSTTARYSAMLTGPVVGHTGPFIAGLRNTDYAPCSGNSGLATTCDGVALTQGTSPAPPFGANAARVNFNSTMFVPTVMTVGTTGADIAGVNAIFRVTGDNLPVELQSFSID